jgi:hypothetical protein
MRRKRYSETGNSLRDRWMFLKWKALRRHQPFDLSFEDFLSIISSACVYGGGKPTEMTMEVDRKDPKAGYTKANCVPCCGRHNLIKSATFSFESMLRIVKEFPEARDCAQTNLKHVRKFNPYLARAPHKGSRGPQSKTLLAMRTVKANPEANIKDIAKEFGVAHKTLRLNLKKLGIEPVLSCGPMNPIHKRPSRSAGPRLVKPKAKRANIRNYIRIRFRTPEDKLAVVQAINRLNRNQEKQVSISRFIANAALEAAKIPNPSAEPAELVLA